MAAAAMAVRAPTRMKRTYLIVFAHAKEERHVLITPNALCDQSLMQEAGEPGCLNPSATHSLGLGMAQGPRV